MNFNLNDYVRVKLTQHGKLILRNEHNELNRYGLLGEWKPPTEDSEGWSEWQLWELMQQLGPHCYNGCEPPIETAIQIIEPKLT